jgi:hypothetical protein
MRCHVCQERKTRCDCNRTSLRYWLAQLPEWQQWTLTGVGYFLIIVLVILGTFK